jgi:hypothetical protein
MFRQLTGVVMVLAAGPALAGPLPGPGVGIVTPSPSVPTVSPDPSTDARMNERLSRADEARRRQQSHERESADAAAIAAMAAEAQARNERAMEGATVEMSMGIVSGLCGAMANSETHTANNAGIIAPPDAHASPPLTPNHSDIVAPTKAHACPPGPPNNAGNVAPTDSRIQTTRKH